jgi:dihydroxyacid dehydratase/phosphogluconate dehydratase
MVSGLPNKEKARIREEHAAGRIGREELLAAESASYHSPGTCTFYGTANSNQMMMEFMGLQLPGGSFVNPNTELREALTSEAVRQVLEITRLGNDYRPIGEKNQLSTASSACWRPAVRPTTRFIWLPLPPLRVSKLTGMIFQTFPG